MKNLMIEVKSLTKKFKNKVALDNVTFNISKNKFHALVGENGSGKTTFIRMAMGLYSTKKYFGAIKVNTDSLFYIPEKTLFPKQFTIKQYLMSAKFMSKHSKEEINLRYIKVIKKYGIDQLLKKKPNTLSSGQKKTLMLARSEIIDSDLIVLDEPSANLDFLSRDRLFKNLKEMTNHGKTIIIVSHMTSEVEKYVDEATILHYGKLMFNGAIKTGQLTKVYLSELNKERGNDVKNVN